MHPLARLVRFWVLTCALLLGACSTVPPGPARPGAPVLDEHAAREVTFKAIGLVDVPYRWGGNTPEGGFDCSGLIQYVYRHGAGLALPRTVAQIAYAGPLVPLAEARAGDLLIFNTAGPYSHAGIYVGERRFVHAPSTGGTVRLDTLGSPYWRGRLALVVRP
jgi:cell wall-associated NlpC family hydrolase